MSLRQVASWMPARKSCASRIIGERAVRAIAVSTSRSTLASVPSTISTRTASTGSSGGRPAGTGSTPPGLAVRRAGRLAADRATGSAPAAGRGGPGQHQVAVRVHPGDEARVQRDRRAELLDHGRAGNLVAGLQPAPGVDRRLGVRLERHRAGAGAGPLVVAVAVRLALQPRPPDRPDPGDPQVHPLHRLVGAAREGVPVQPVVRGVEGLDRRLGRARVHRFLCGPGVWARSVGRCGGPGGEPVAARQGDPDLVGLAGVAQVRAAHQLSQRRPGTPRRPAPRPPAAPGRRRSPSPGPGPAGRAAAPRSARSRPGRRR